MHSAKIYMCKNIHCTVQKYTCINTVWYNLSHFSGTINPNTCTCRCDIAQPEIMVRHWTISDRITVGLTKWSNDPQSFSWAKRHVCCIYSMRFKFMRFKSHVWTILCVKVRIRGIANHKLLLTFRNSLFSQTKNHYS